jgi:hypothetical protein
MNNIIKKTLITVFIIIVFIGLLNLLPAIAVQIIGFSILSIIFLCILIIFCLIFLMAANIEN